MEYPETPFDREEGEREREAESQEVVREAAKVVPTPELYRACLKFFYAAQNHEETEAIRRGKVPHEKKFKTYPEFLEYFEELRKNNPEELLGRVRSWIIGFRAKYRENGDIVREIGESINWDFEAPSSEEADGGRQE